MNECPCAPGQAGAQPGSTSFWAPAFAGSTVMFKDRQ